MDLPLKRVRQITAAIAERKYIEDKRNRHYISWAVQAVSCITAASSGNLGEDGAFDTMMESIHGMSLKTGDEIKFEELHPVKPVQQQGSYDTLVKGMQGFANIPAGGETDSAGNMLINIVEAEEGPPPLPSFDEVWKQESEPII